MPIRHSPFTNENGKFHNTKRILAVTAELIHSARREWGDTYRRPGHLPVYHAAEYGTMDDAYLKPGEPRPQPKPLPDRLPPVPAAPGNPLFELTALFPAPVENTLWHRDERIPLYPPMGYEEHGLAFTTRGQMDRFTLARSFAWAVPSPGDIAFIKKHAQDQGIVEVGAGSGYWAWQLRQAGMTVHAYDLKPPGERNPFAPVGPYSPVTYGGATTSAKHPDCALLLCWPPYNESMARRALDAYKGDTVFYTGEPYGGCTGDDAFHQHLERSFTQEDTSSEHLSWEGVHCSLSVWRRRTY